MSALARLIAVTASPSETPLARLKEIVVAGNCAEMGHDQRPEPLFHMDDGRKRNLAVGGRGVGRQIDRVQPLDRFLHRGLALHDDAILVRLGVDRRDDALAEQVVEDVVHRRRRDAEARGGLAVDGDVERRALLLHVAADVRQLRRLAQAVGQLRRPFREQSRIGAFQHEFILRAGDAGVDRQVLRRLHVELDALDMRGLAAEAADDFGDAVGALALRLQIDQEAAGIERHVGAVDPDEGGDRGDVAVVEQDLGQLALQARPSP